MEKITKSLLSRLILTRKTFISMVFVGLTMLGYISYRNLAVELYPDAELPLLIVQINTLLEVTPSYVETQAVIPLEGAISTLEGIEEIQTFIDSRRGTITLYFRQNVDIKYAYLKLQEKVNEIKSSLPDEFVVNVIKIDTEQLSNLFMELQVRGSGGVDRVRNITDQEIVGELETVDGIAGVSVYGGREKSVEIVIDEDVCHALGITPYQIRSAILQNGQNRSFVGSLYNSNKKYYVNVIAEYEKISDLENIVISNTGPIFLKDVSDINFGVKEETSISRVNGKEAVTVRLIRDQRVNLIDLSHTTKELIKKLNERLKYKDIEIIIQSNTAEIMEKNIKLIIQLAIVGGILAVAILWIFLKNLKLVFVIALAIPISVFTTFNLFYGFGITINTLTMVGMALAIGMLLDNSVVVLENIYRLVSRGKERDTAVIQGTREVWRSIFAATLTTVVVFVPFAFTSNFFIKLFGRHVSISIISTLFVSLIVALFLIPMVVHYYLTRRSDISNSVFRHISQNSRIIQIYTLLLKSCMRYPVRTLIGASIFTILSVFICLALSFDVSREIETPEFNLSLTMPEGTTLESTDLAVVEIEKRLEGLEEKEEVISKIDAGEATITITLKDNFEKIKNRTVAQIKNDIKKRIDDFYLGDITFEQPQITFAGSKRGGTINPGEGFLRMLGIGTQRERIVIKGRDFNRMKKTAEDIEYFLENIDEIDWVRMNISKERPEVHIYFDKYITSHFGIDAISVSRELSTFQNQFPSGMVFKQGNEEYEIIISTSQEEKKNKTIDDLRNLTIVGAGGSVSQLQHISNIVFASGLGSIRRVNQERQIEVVYKFLDEINQSKGLLKAAREKIDNLISEMRVPAGIALEVLHDETELTEFYYLIGAAFILIYMILSAVFESFYLPLVIMFSIPFAAAGSFWLLIFTGHGLSNANTLMGFIILLGIVVNNSIILIDYTRILRKRGFTRNRALITAGQARLRPITITAVTTITAMIPLALGKAEYVTQIGAPFAITVIGGLSLSTLLTLIIIPTFYSGMENAINWEKSLNWKIKIFHLILLILCFWFILNNIHNFIWKIIASVSSVVTIPALTYFIMTSLRQAKTRLIGRDEKIIIKIQNLVKIYDRESRFIREWKKGERIEKHSGTAKAYLSLRDFDSYLWKIPLLGFLIYFIYFYIRSGLWIFILSHLLYTYIFFLLHPIRLYLTNRSNKKLANTIDRSFFWGFPLINLIIFQMKWHNIGVVLLIGFIWSFLLIIYTTSNRIHSKKINIARIDGKLSGLRKGFYRFVQLIPFIGRKKRPFRALNRISVEIGSGMFGLLGPNGAGKTTLMRIICGILEQSYGKIWINGLDVNKYREELQGLIGYLPQEFGAYENMTAWEFLNYQAILKNIIDRKEREKRVDYVLSAVHMDEHKHDRIGSFSGGMKQRIGIAQILLHLPRILVVDEPTAGLDPRERIRFRNLLVELSRDRVVIFSTHIIEDISSSCNKVAVLNKGELKYLGNPVDMTHIARGHVWQFVVNLEEFESLRKSMLVVHHMRDGKKIRVRCISEKKPYKNAKSVLPTLEDAYLWLLKEKSSMVSQEQ